MQWKKLIVQSPQHKDIKSHLTPREKWVYCGFGLLCGGWFGATFAAPAASGFTRPFESPSFAAYLCNGAFATLGVMGMVLLQKKFLTFLGSTQRARQQGYDKDNF